jgi:hypothetical protein
LADEKARADTNMKEQITDFNRRQMLDNSEQ